MEAGAKTKTPLASGQAGFQLGLRCSYATGFLRISASARKRVESAGLFAVVALASRDGAMPFNFATLLSLMWDFSALAIAFCRELICFAGKACERAS